MKVFIIKDVYISPSNIHIKTDIKNVFSTLKSLLIFLNTREENWGPLHAHEFSDGLTIVYKNYFDLETFYIADDSDKVYYILYQNNLGYFNNPEVCKNKPEAERRIQENDKIKKICKLKEIGIDSVTN